MQFFRGLSNKCRENFKHLSFIVLSVALVACSNEKNEEINKVELVNPDSKYYADIDVSRLNSFDVSDCQRAALATGNGISKDMFNYLIKVSANKTMKEWQDEQYDIYQCSEADKKISAEDFERIIKSHETMEPSKLDRSQEGSSNTNSYRDTSIGSTEIPSGCEEFSRSEIGDVTTVGYNCNGFWITVQNGKIVQKSAR